VLEAAGEGRSQPPYLGLAHVGLAEVLYERDELTAALDHATRGVTLCRQLAFTPPLATGLAVVARILQAHGDAAGALEAMGEAGQAGLSPQVAALFNPVPSQRARLLLAQGDVPAAAQWATAAGLSPDGEPDYPQEPAYLVLARVLLAQMTQARHLPSWSGCSAPRPARAGPAASSRSRRCGRWRWPPAAITPAPSAR
jgi:LuxR family maltose regulon positive regulatory protein